MRACLLGVAALACLLAAPAIAGTVDYVMVPVGNPGNAADSTGYGDVGYAYQIGKYDVTIGQYTDFLNAVAATDTYSLYNGAMGIEPSIRGISRSGEPGSYSYSVMAASGSAPYGGVTAANRPITDVSWWDSARFANWLANGQPSGAQSSTTTENGAYNLNGAIYGTAPAKNVINPNTGAAPTFFIPTENEWYKAAYYSPVLNSGSGGYYTYATQSNAVPGNVPGSGSNQANYNNGVYSVTQSTVSQFQNYLTDVGAFTNSASYYGTFDQTGNVYQWNDLNGLPGSSRGVRGGNWLGEAWRLPSSFRSTESTQYEYVIYGFRLAGPAASPVPEIDPSSFGSAFALLIGSLCWMERRARRAVGPATAA